MIRLVIGMLKKDLEGIMEIKFVYKICFIFVMGVLFVCCNSKKQKIDSLRLCYEFYELNNNLDLNRLLNVQILGIREYTDYNDSTLKYERIPVVIGINDSISKLNIKLPVFRRNAGLEEQKLFFGRCDSLSISYLKNKYKIISDDELFKCYVKEVNCIYFDYFKVKIPSELPCGNIEIVGDGDYVKFVLYENKEEQINIKCYYVKESSCLNEAEKKFFKGLIRLGNNWYCDLN